MVAGTQRSGRSDDSAADDEVWTDAAAVSGDATSSAPVRRSMAVASPARAIGWLAVSGFVLVVLRRAWMCDDAFITMRAIDNLIHGRGFAYNAGELVLGFTNPLWALLLVLPYAVLQDPYLTPIIAGVLVSAVFGWSLVFRVAKDPRAGALVLAALCFSRSFTDFSTGGLENALTHWLLLLLLASMFEATSPTAEKSSAPVGRVLAIAALSLVNRIDSAALIAPPVAWFLWHERARLRPRTILLGLSPALAWFAFAGVYYGFFLPNTAYAKLNAHIPRGEMLRQGLAYVFESLVNDPVTLILVSLSMLVIVSVGRRGSEAPDSALVRAIGAGILLDVLYVIGIGGDFMAGRFLTPALAACAIVLARHATDWLVDGARFRVAGAVAGFVALTTPFSPFHRDAEKPTLPSHKVLDERAYYASDFGLADNLRVLEWQKGLFANGRAARDKGEKVVVYNNVGTFAWGAGPSVHVIDELALTDPLLSRMPFEYDDGWRPGHLARKVPSGYAASIASGENRIKDPCIHAYYDKLRRIVNGPLFTAERFQAIVALNLPGGATIRPCR